MNSSLLSAALDVPSLGHSSNGNDNNEDDDADNDYAIDYGGLPPMSSPPSGGASYFQDHPEPSSSNSALHDSESSFIPASSMSSFDTPRIDNVTGAQRQIIKTAGSSSALSSGSMNSWLTNGSGENPGNDDYMFRHSDFTIPTSNNSNGDGLKAAPPPPPSLATEDMKSNNPYVNNHQKNHRNVMKTPTSQSTKNARKANSTPGKRSIMGTTVAKKYRCFHLNGNGSSNNNTSPKLPTMRLSPGRGTTKEAQLPPKQRHHDLLLQPPSDDPLTPPDSPSLLMFHEDKKKNSEQKTTKANQDGNISGSPQTPSKAEENDEFEDAPTITLDKKSNPPQALSPLTPAYPNHLTNSDNTRQISSNSTKLTTSMNRPPESLSSSRMQPRVVPMSYQHSDTPDWNYQDQIDDMDNVFRYNINGKGSSGNLSTGRLCKVPAAAAVHETTHAQSLLLGFAFMSVWLPNNVMAPNLTQMAEYFDMSNEDRDQYLGSYCALAVGVFSLPLSGGIGFLSDVYPRKSLFLACVLIGALSSFWTGYSKTYWSLFFARLVSGGCMSGSVPVAFSLLGDLFSTEERNAASSGLTAMMGLGILAGQVYAGMFGPIKGWQHPFYVAAVVQMITTAVMAIYVAEPVRGGMEKSLQNVQYNRKLTWNGFVHAMQNNASNSILIWQGFVTSIPWGVVLVFLNDFLSQEKGFSVPEATVLVMLFGIGCGIGGVLGGYIGGILMKQNRSFLPLYMAATTFLGTLPFLFLLNTDFPHHNGYKAKFLSILGGTVASLPSVNVRPCIINVNMPETRGAALTAANLLVTLGRGIGPACIVLMGSIFALTRQTSFTVTLLVFWTISALQLVLLAKTLPEDMHAVEAALEQYAVTARGSDGDGNKAPSSPVKTETSRLLLPSSPGGTMIEGDGDTIMSIEDLAIAFDGTAARRSLQFVRLGIQELNEEISHRQQSCLPCESTIQEEDDSQPDNANNSLLDDEDITDDEIQRRRDVWLRQQQQGRD